MGIMDFAGGLVIHSTAGVAGLVVSIMLQRRLRHKKLVAKQTSHNLPMAALGASLTLAAWFSFCGGSAMGANGTAVLAVFNTHMAACAGGLVCMILAYREDGHWHLSEILNGAIAACATMTPGSGFVPPWSSIIVGALGGSAMFFSARLIKRRWGIDDVLDVCAMQGITGSLGTLLTGLLASTDANPAGSDGLFFGGSGKVFGVQLLGVVITWAWTIFCTILVVYLMRMTVGLDVSPEAEEMGLDKVQIGESAYDQDLNALLDLGSDALTTKLCEAAAAGDLAEVRNFLSLGADATLADYDGRTALHLAAAEGHLSVVKLLAERHGVDLNALDRYNGTPLLDAVTHDHDQVARWLRAHGAHVSDASMRTLGAKLRTAASKGDTNSISRLVGVAGVHPDAADYDARTPLMLAAAEGHGDAVMLLLQLGADPSLTDRFGSTALDDARRFQRWDVATILENPKSVSVRKAMQQHVSIDMGQDAQQKRSSTSLDAERTPLLVSPGTASSSSSSAHPTTASFHVSSMSNASSMSLTSAAPVVVSSSSAASNSKGGPNAANRISAATREVCAAASDGDISEVKKLVKKGADPSLPDYDGRTALHLAACGGHYEVVQFLLSPVCRQSININAMDRWRQTALSEAVAHGHLAVAQLLRHQGATVVNRELGHALCDAAARGALDELQRMVASGADLSVSDYDGRTAMHLAAAEGHEDVLVWLLKYGAPAFAKDRFGNSPADDARRHGHKGILRLLAEFKRQAKAARASDDSDEEAESENAENAALLRKRNRGKDEE
jgi:ankyrin repeat protein